MTDLRLRQLLTGNGNGFTGPDLDRLEELFSDTTGAVETARVSGEDRVLLERAYGRLTASGVPKTSGLDTYINRLQSVLTEPTASIIEKDLTNRLGLRGPAESTYRSLSTLAKEGLYALLVRGVSGENLTTFLANPATDHERIGGVEEILRQAALLYDSGVQGFEDAFSPTELDKKFLSDDPSRIHSLLAEWREALWLASATDATGVRLGQRLAIDWKELTPEESNYLRENVEPDLPAEFRGRYREQTTVEVDGFVYRGPGRPRILEVKTTLKKRYAVTKEELAKIRLQIIRQALLVRKHGLSGIEIVIRAGEVPEEHIRSIYQTLKLTGVPFLIRLEGGKKQEVVEGGLSYQVTGHGVVETRKNRTERSLPFPKVITNDVVETDGDEVEEDVEGLPWTGDMRKFLEGILQFSIGRRSIKEFMELVRHNLRYPDFKLVVERIQEKPNDPNMAEEKKEAIERELRGFARVRATNTFSNETLEYLVRIAAIATGSEVENVETVDAAGPVEENLKQYLQFNRYGIETTLENLLTDIEGTINTAKELLEDVSVSAINWADLSELIDAMKLVDPGQTVVEKYDERTFTIRHMLWVMTETSDAVFWTPKLIERLRAAIKNYDKLDSEIEGLRTKLPPPSPQRVEDVFEPIPPEVLGGLRDSVRDLGPLPERGKSGRGKTVNPPKAEEYNNARVGGFFNQLILLHPEGEDSKYYYPEDLKRIQRLVTAYLRRCGFAEKDIEDKLNEITGLELKRLGGGAMPVKTLQDIIPAGFERTDLIKAADRFSGARLDVTRAIADLWRKGPHTELNNGIRVVVMENGRKIYFADWDWVRKNYPDVTWQLPTFKELKDILGKKDGVIKFFDALSRRRGWGSISGGDGKITLSGWKDRAGDEATVIGLKVEAGEISYHKGPFQLVFAKGTDSFWRLISARGMGGLELALEYLGKTNADPVEKAVLAEKLGANAQAVTFGTLKGYFAKEGVVDQLVDFFMLIGPALAERPGIITLSGAKNGSGDEATISGLKVKAGAITYPKGFFQLVFERGVDGFWHLISAKSSGGLELALEYLGKTDADPVEKAVLAERLGTNAQAVTLGMLKEYLAKKDAIDQLVDFFMLVGSALAKRPGIITLSGQKHRAGDESIITGLKVKAGEITCQKWFFQLVFERGVDGFWHLISAKGVGGLELKDAFEGIGDKVEPKTEVKRTGTSGGGQIFAPDAGQRERDREALRPKPERSGQTGPLPPPKPMITPMPDKPVLPTTISGGKPVDLTKSSTLKGPDMGEAQKIRDLFKLPPSVGRYVGPSSQAPAPVVVALAAVAPQVKFQSINFPEIDAAVLSMQRMARLIAGSMTPDMAVAGAGRGVSGWTTNMLFRETAPQPLRPTISATIGAKSAIPKAHAVGSSGGVGGFAVGAIGWGITILTTREEDLKRMEIQYHVMNGDEVTYRNL